MTNRFVGSLEKIIDHGIRGWVIDTTDPKAALMVEVSLDDVFNCTVPANLYRKNLWNSTCGNHGFEIKLLDLPVALFDQPVNSISAKVTTTDYELANSPVSFDPVTVAASLCELIQSDIHQCQARFQRQQGLLAQ